MRHYGGFVQKNLTKAAASPENLPKGVSHDDVSRILSGLHSRPVYFDSGLFDLSKSWFPSGVGGSGFFAGLRSAACFPATGADALAQSSG